MKVLLYLVLLSAGALWAYSTLPADAPVGAEGHAASDRAFPRRDASGEGAPDLSPARVAAYAGPSPAVSPDLDGLEPVPSDFDRLSQIVPSPDEASPTEDIVGAFRFICQPGQLNWDDPIVYPGQPNASPHLHQWFGNVEANALSTFRSLRGSGESTCMGPLNRSAYWIPAMIAGGDTVVRPDYIFVYYKRYPRSSTECAIVARDCLPLPHGLRYIFGYDTQRIGEAQPENLIFQWKCVTPGDKVRGQIAARFDALDCPAGDQLMVVLTAPDCWDGRNLDSTNHRSHIVYPRSGQLGGLPRCPESHPYLVPQFTIGVAWRVAEGERIADWHLASDRMPGMPELPPGGSFHSDWYGAWDDETMRAWTENCINGKLSCVDGQLGDGTAMKRPPGFGYTASPRLVPVPRRGEAAPMRHHN